MTIPRNSNGSAKGQKASVFERLGAPNVVAVRKSVPQKVSGNVSSHRPSVFNRLMPSGRNNEFERLNRQFATHKIHPRGYHQYRPGTKMPSHEELLGKDRLPIVGEDPIPKGKRHVAEVSMEGGMSSLRIVVRNEESAGAQRMIKPSAKVEEGKWHMNKQAERDKAVNIGPQ